MQPVADVSVRPASTADAPAIAALQLQAWRRALGEDAVAGLVAEQVERTWEDAVRPGGDADQRVLVATAGPAVVGFAASAPRRTPDESGWTTEVVALEVTGPQQRQGHGSRLLAAVVDLARERGAHHVAAWTLEDDDARRAFLDASGLAEAGVRRVLDVPGGHRHEILLTGAIGERGPTAPHAHNH